MSKDSDVYPSGGSGHQNRHNKSPKQDVEELEAYRASFGFSADEIITTTQYVEISDDVMQDSFTMNPFTTNKLPMEENTEPASVIEGLKAQKTQTNLLSQKSLDEGVRCDVPVLYNGHEGELSLLDLKLHYCYIGCQEQLINLNLS